AAKRSKSPPARAAVLLLFSLQLVLPLMLIVLVARMPARSRGGFGTQVAAIAAAIFAARLVGLQHEEVVAVARCGVRRNLWMVPRRGNHGSRPRIRRWPRMRRRLNDGDLLRGCKRDEFPVSERGYTAGGSFHADHSERIDGGGGAI
ncbi:MAG TPA: hypothetical protein VF625_18305, partial [Longimicrobium sp.]